MNRPFADKRPIGPIVMSSGGDSAGLRVYHTTSKSNLDQIRDDGLRGSISTGKTDKVEKAMELTRPEKYPSRLNAVFAYEDSGVAQSSEKGDIVISFDASKAPCAGYGVRAGSGLMGIADLVLKMGKAPDNPRVKAGSREVWEEDIEGPIRTQQDLQEVNSRFDFGSIQEIYFPCDIPPDIIKVER